ncbi:MAG TPA: NarK family nitrate/nitrite MFS transporter [Polyangiaceae bacterium]|jgi:NNP family nitrate/nitrite transporter-like MFS transporter
MSRWIEHFNPEDEIFWEKEGKRVARRNLIWSILAEHVGFSVWMMWSVVAPRLPKVGFHYTTDQLFTLVAVPGLVGALLRFPYTFAVPRFGGRNWTTVSALLLLIPASLLILLVNRPDTPFGVMLAAAATAGFGGGNFASSMANISFFYPDKKKGLALGLNAAGGNIGVSSVQLFVPIVIAAGVGGGLHLANAGLVWLPAIVVASIGAAAFMDNLSGAKSNFKDQVVVMRQKHTFIMSILYVATFGSFVGYSAAFPLLIKTQFPAVTANLAFLGALVGSLSRPFGGFMADRLGGARVTFWNFIAMALLTLGVLHFVELKDFRGFLVMFLLLFVTTGIGNGSTFRMIPVIFREKALRGAGSAPEQQAAALVTARRETAAVLGVSSAIGAVGGYFIPRGFGASIKATGGPSTALFWFFGYYVVCIALTWWYYRRTRFLASRMPSLARANA